MSAAVIGMTLLCGIAQAAEPKIVTNTFGMELIEIPAGKFTMARPAGDMLATTPDSGAGDH